MVVILAATSNYAKDSTKTIAVTSIRRFYDIVTFIEAATRRLVWKRYR